VIGPLNKKQLEVVRLIVWERLLRNPEYRADYFDLLEAPFSLDLDSYMEKYNAFVEKWKLPTPLHPDWNWEEIAQYKENWKWFIGHTLGLFDYPVISKPLVKEILRNLFEEHPSLLNTKVLEVFKGQVNFYLTEIYAGEYQVYRECLLDS